MPGIRAERRSALERSNGARTALAAVRTALGDNTSAPKCIEGVKGTANGIFKGWLHVKLCLSSGIGIDHRTSDEIHPVFCPDSVSYCIEHFRVGRMKRNGV